MGTGSLSQSDLKPSSLVAFLKTSDSFSYFEKSTAIIRDLPDESFSGRGTEGDRKRLLNLWSSVLTDALRGLKRRDSREWKDGPGIDFDSFFNEDSLGIPELKKVVEAFATFESLMYGASPKWYRDHVVHSFQVWVIGHRLLGDSLGGKLVTDASELGVDCLGIEPEEWQCMWALTALCHDIGYPLSMIEKINKLARDSLQQQGLRSVSDLRFSFSREMQPFYETITELMSSKIVQEGDTPGDTSAETPAGKASQGEDRLRFLTHLQSKYYLKFLNAFDQQDHGVVSALLMAKSLVYFLESDLSKDSRWPLKPEDARQFLIRREVLRAIASHHCPDIYHLKFNTLSFLLYITDEIQESGRPTLEESYRSPSGPDEVEVSVPEFREKAVRIEIKTPAPWLDCADAVQNRLSGMRRRLRLAVDAPKMKDLSFGFTIASKSGGGKKLSLQNGRINCEELQKAKRRGK